jgi:hypothetical protein
MVKNTERRNKFLSERENKKVFEILDYVINHQFKKQSVINLANYMGRGMVNDPPTNNNEYQKKINAPMETIFNQIKHTLVKKGLPVSNSVYELPGTNKLFLAVAIFSTNGASWFNSAVSDREGENANTFENSPLGFNTILGVKTRYGYIPFNGYTHPAQTGIMIDKNPDARGPSTGYLTQFKNFAYRICGKLIDEESKLTVGVLAFALYNIDKSMIDKILTE